MRQRIRIIRKVSLEKQYIDILKAELDYELGSLHLALEQEDEKEIGRAKARLAEIQNELDELILK